jgi:hypothetical protein
MISADALCAARSETELAATAAARKCFERRDPDALAPTVVRVMSVISVSPVNVEISLRVQI